MDAAELAILQNANLQEQDPEWRAYPKPGTRSLSKAHEILRVSLVSPETKAQSASRKRLEKAYDTFNDTSTFDDVLKLFNDLDCLLFQGELKHRVFIEWCRHPYMFGGNAFSMLTIGTAIGTEAAPATRLSIHLDTEYAWLGGKFNLGKSYVWGILIHEMLHCYIAVSIGVDQDLGVLSAEECECGARVIHGPMWQESARLLAQKLDLAGLELKCITEFRGYCHQWNGREEWEANKRRKAEEKAARRWMWLKKTRASLITWFDGLTLYPERWLARRWVA